MEKAPKWCSVYLLIGMGLVGIFFGYLPMELETRARDQLHLLGKELAGIHNDLDYPPATLTPLDRRALFQRSRVLEGDYEKLAIRVAYKKAYHPYARLLSYLVMLSFFLNFWRESAYRSALTFGAVCLIAVRLPRAQGTGLIMLWLLLDSAAGLFLKHRGRKAEART